MTHRQRLEEAIERAIDLLDALDGDADDEVDTALDQDEAPMTLNPAWQRPTRPVKGR